MKTRNRLFATLLGALALAALLATPSAARAQAAPVLDTLTIRVWPEFDQPSALVFLVGKVTDTTATPTTLVFPLPPGAQINAVAYTDPTTGDLITAQYTQQSSGITLTTPNGSYWVEFYDPALKIDGSQRTYSLSFAAPYDVNMVVWEVQQPAGASAFSVEPAGGVTTTDQFGLPTYTNNRLGVKAGDMLTLNLSYTKTDNTLTIDTLPPSDTSAGGSVPSTTQGTAATTTGSPSTLVIALLIVGGVALIGGGVFWYVRSSARPSARRRPPAGGGGKNFCTQCGKPVQPADQFCRHCGAKLKG
jgi:hypothetical protein